MTKISVPSKTLQRFIKLYESLDPKAPETLKCLRIEIINGKIILIGCNQYVACAELIDNTKESDAVIHVKVNSKFIESVNKEVNINGMFNFETIPEIALGNISTTDGENHNDFIVWPDESPLDNWRKWFSISDESAGTMFCNLYQIETLFNTSPTGEITFPTVINCSEPVIVRDINNSNWIGAFIPAFDGKKIIKPAELPEWL